jgi:hypothetical protein
MMLSEIRESTRIQLIDKVRRHDYGKYLHKASLLKIRAFSGEDITFEFPVTALIGPNGSGKSSVLGVAGCAYKIIKPGTFFPKSTIGDESMSGWKAEFELIDKASSPKQLVKRSCNFRQSKWARSEVLDRSVLYFGIERTVPAGEKSKYKKLTSSTYVHSSPMETIDPATAKQIEHILGKSVSDFKVTDIGHRESFFVGKNGTTSYSEFHFGAGESSIIRIVTEIEKAEPNSLILIEEIENGLHPIATRRMVEYLIEVAERKSIQSIFTTHSDYAIAPLPKEAIWACIDGRLHQGKLSVAALRAVSGRIDKKLAIFVEDIFSKHWVEAILRETMKGDIDQIEVHSVSGDGTAVKTHLGHISNPAIKFKSLCVIDGDSKQSEDSTKGVVRLPGKQPELSVFEFVTGRLTSDLAILTVSLQLAPEAQENIRKILAEVSCTNRDPHLLFNQIGIAAGFIPEPIVRGAFLSLWVRNNMDFCKTLTEFVVTSLAV